MCFRLQKVEKKCLKDGTLKVAWVDQVLKYRFVLECFGHRLEEFGSLLHNQALPGDLDTIALWNIVSIRFRYTNFAIKILLLKH